MGSKLLAPQGEAGSCGFPPNCMAYARGGAYGESLYQTSLPILIWALSDLQNE